MTYGLSNNHVTAMTAYDPKGAVKQ